MARNAGRHFLQIPGPTNVPDRVLRAIDFPTMDHRGPDFAALGKATLAGMKRSVPSWRTTTPARSRFVPAIYAAFRRTSRASMSWNKMRHASKLDR